MTIEGSSTPWLSSAARMEAAAAGAAEVTSATASPTYQWKLGGDRRSGDDLGQGDGNKSPIRTKNYRAAVHRAAPKRNRRSSMPATGSSCHPTTAMIQAVTFATMEYSSTPWRCSAARMERGPTHRGDLDTGYLDRA